MKKFWSLCLGLLFCSAVWAADEHEISVELRVPDSTWSIHIDRVYQVGEELWVVSTVSQDPNLMGAMVISTVKSSIKLPVEDIPVKYYVLGKTWNWENDEPYIFLKDLSVIKKELDRAKLLYPVE